MNTQPTYNQESDWWNDHSILKNVVRWSREMLSTAPDRVLLGGNKIPPALRPIVALQVELHNKLEQKAPHWVKKGCILARRINFEQASNQATARYKCRFVHSEDRLADLTGGFGVDFFTLAEKVERAYYFDLDYATAAAARFNAALLFPEGKEISIECGDSLAALPKLVHQKHCTLIMADPARRGNADKRLYNPNETTPSPGEIVKKLREEKYTGQLLLKLSPMADLPELRKQLPWVHEFHIVAVRDELKEILAYGTPNKTNITDEELLFRVVLLDSTGQETAVFSYYEKEIHQADLSIVDSETIERWIRDKNNLQEQWLYIPHAAIMKSKAFALLSQKWALSALSHNSHLFVSNQKIEPFPGRCLKIEECIPFSKKELKSLSARCPRLSITVKNFPLRAEELKKMLHTQESSENTLVATTGAENQKLLFICHRT